MAYCLIDLAGKKPLVIGLVLFLIGCCWSIFAHSYTDFLLSRIVQGVGAGSCMALSRAIARDCFDGADYVRAITYLTSGFAFGLGVTPLIGGHLLDFFSWRAEFIFLFIISLALLLSILWLLPETCDMSALTLPSKQFYNQTLRNIITTVKIKNFIYCLIGGVAAYSVVIAYSTMTPFLFQRTLGYSPPGYGWLTFIIACVYYC